MAAGRCKTRPPQLFLSKFAVVWCQTAGGTINRHLWKKKLNTGNYGREGRAQEAARKELPCRCAFPATNWLYILVCVCTAVRPQDITPSWVRAFWACATTLTSSTFPTKAPAAKKKQRRLIAVCCFELVAGVLEQQVEGERTSNVHVLNRPDLFPTSPQVLLSNYSMSFSCGRARCANT